jgi:AraC-like DNA-binding protein
VPVQQIHAADRLGGAVWSRRTLRGLSEYHIAEHPRTLNRRLGRSGTTYRQLREECHHAFACQLLLDTELPIAEIAARLGYANAPTFTRAFCRWSGSSPAAWRSARRKG